jgi:hypothetical protein
LGRALKKKQHNNNLGYNKIGGFEPEKLFAGWR